MHSAELVNFSHFFVDFTCRLGYNLIILYNIQGKVFIMKKIFLALTLALCLALSLVALTSCGGSGDDCDHVWASMATVDTAATCTTDGSKSIKCLDCGEKQADSVTVIPAPTRRFVLQTAIYLSQTRKGRVHNAPFYQLLNQQHREIINVGSCGTGDNKTTAFFQCRVGIVVLQYFTDADAL